MKKEKRRIKDRETRIAEIQEGAKKVFFQNGFQSPSVEAIAREAGLSKGTIYLYFKSKERIYTSLMLPVARELGKRLRDFESHMDRRHSQSLSELTMAFFRLYYDLYKFDPDGIRLIQTFQQSDLFSRIPGRIRGGLAKQARENFQAARRILAKGNHGLMNSREIAQLLDVIWAMFLGVVQLEESKYRTTGKDHLPETLKFGFSLIANSLKNFPEARPQLTLPVFGEKM